jgi:hypothetical protein
MAYQAKQRRQLRIYCWRHHSVHTEVFFGVQHFSSFKKFCRGLYRFLSKFYYPTAMNILIPVNENDADEAKIVPVIEAKFWAFVELDERQQPTINFFETYQEITDEINTVVVKDPNDYVWPFLEQYIQVLVAPMQRSIDDILEAYMFKELHDLSF